MEIIIKIQTSDLKTERQWRSATGINKGQFSILLEIFESSYLACYGKNIATKKQESKFNFCIENENELLYFTLFSLKSGLTYDLLGVVCGMDASNAKRNQNIGLKALKHALDEQGYMPKRKFMNKKEFDIYFDGINELLIDATEQQIQRPSDNEVQKEFYSGKKKAIQ